MKNNNLLPFECLHIHGDNIVECERALAIILQSLADVIESISPPGFSITCPRYLLKLKGATKPLSVTFYPGFGRWDYDILQSVRDRGGVLREAADVIVTAAHNGEEMPLFAIEFCGALPAGNQAWQRSGRAFSFGMAQIPYLYISEIGGYELDSNRRRKAPRMPNAAVPFSYLAFSIEHETPVFPIFVTAPGADTDSRKVFADVFADQELIDLVCAHLYQDDDAEIFDILQQKVLSFVKKRADSSRKGETLSREQWQTAFDELKNTNGLSNFLVTKVRQDWSKTAYIDALTDRAKALMAVGSRHGIGLTGTKLPMCLLDRDARSRFASDVNKLFPELDSEFKEFLNHPESLAICWVMGFKPRGDDARPDRGLAPLTRMLVGSDHEMLTIVYGPAPEATWKALVKQPEKLAARNGLWEAIMEASDALLVEAATDHVSKKGYIRSEWVEDLLEKRSEPFFVTPCPKRLGENDVDTALHLLLSKFIGKDVFEGMCNPPGGDWSGVSILGDSREMEYRWLSLPRVSGADMKRPDHVFQIFAPTCMPSTILSIESKETPKSLETKIGPRLTAYLHYLFASPASIEKKHSSEDWEHSTRKVSLGDYRFLSAGAFLMGDPEKVLDAVQRSKTDLTFVVDFLNSGKSCQIFIYSSTSNGREIAEYIAANVEDSEIIAVKVIN
ncbi:MAG TPA: hypothetical protein DD827_03345 [Gammaproteobacteria bacterium]|jgi:hypothetical protein|nr:hypothetical protein [Gammaproteobacteria bacterium]